MLDTYLSKLLQTGAEGKGINDNGKYARRNVRDDGILIK
jgi:hypothetical protein